MTQPHYRLTWLVALLIVCAAGFCRAAEPPAAAAPAADKTTGITLPRAKQMWVYIGTYTGPKSKGIYLFHLDHTTGILTPSGVAGEVSNPSFLAVHPTNKYIYAVGEVDNFGGKKAGAVTAFSIDRTTGKLTLLNQQPSGGRGPCHVSVDKEGKNALVANYGSGSVAGLPIGEDGKLAAPSSQIQHEGKSANPRRQ